MAWDLPVCANMHEATAFANWKSQKMGSTFRVISELEHHAIRDQSQQLSDMTSAVDMVIKGDPHGKMMTEVSILRESESYFVSTHARRILSFLPSII